MLMRRGGEGIGCVLLSGLYVVLSAPPVRGQTVPQFGHVLIVLEENHGYSQVVGSSSMPYLNSLISKYGLATNYVADTHPSIDNSSPARSWWHRAWRSPRGASMRRHDDTLAPL